MIYYYLNSVYGLLLPPFEFAEKNPNNTCKNMIKVNTV